jgi:GNAT superfamily N-acetyltransferase
LEKIKNGGTFFVALNRKNEVVHHTWVEQGKINIPNFFLDCILPTATAYFASSFTPRRFRNQGLGKYVRSHVLRYCRDKFFKQVILNVEDRNEASIALAKSMGFAEYERVSFFRFLGIQLYKVTGIEPGSIAYYLGGGPMILNRFLPLR